MLVVVPRTGHVVTVGLGDVVLEFDQGGGSPKMDGTARPRPPSSSRPTPGAADPRPGPATETARSRPRT